jgi:tRNA pseudouridine38-40 synthase
MQIQYLGGRFSGSQFQVRVRTVQDELEKAVGTFLRLPGGRAKLHFSGRTDSGVHARGQVAHFDCEDEFDAWRFCRAMNGILERDVSITEAQVVPDDFHSRFSAIRRTYAYRILNKPHRAALCHDTHVVVPYRLNLSLITELAGQFVGSHDFLGFKSTNSDKGTTVCNVDRAEILNLGEGELEFWISANHFVYNMVRIIVGTLIEIGLGKQPMTDLGEALHDRQRLKAGPTAPPWGLCLESVEYPEKYRLFEATSFKVQERSSDYQEIHRE